MGAASGRLFPEGVPENILEWNEKHMKIAAVFYFDLYDANDSDSIEAEELDTLLKGVYDDCQHALVMQGCPVPDDMTAPDAEDFLGEHDLDGNDSLNSGELCPPLVDLFQQVKAIALLRSEWDAHIDATFTTAQVEAMTLEDFKEAGGLSLTAEVAFDDDAGGEPDEDLVEWLDESCAQAVEAFEELEEEDEEEDEEKEFTRQELQARMGKALLTFQPAQLPNAPARQSVRAKGEKAKKKAKAAKNPPKKKLQHPKRAARKAARAAADKGTKEKAPKRAARKVEA